jgi:hypothetical protein
MEPGRDIESLLQAEPSRYRQVFTRHRNKIVLVGLSLLIHLAYTWFSQRGGAPGQGSNIILHVEACDAGNHNIAGASIACRLRGNQTI